MKYGIATLILAGWFLHAGVARAGVVPTTLTQQGRLLNSDGTPTTGMVQMTFALYAVATGGTPAPWTETQMVTLDNGYFSVQLGASTPISQPLWDGTTKYLGITVGSDPEMTPRETLTSVPYALVANDAISDIHPNSVTVNSGKAALLYSDGNGGNAGIELGGTNALAGTGTPYIDFHVNATAAQDFNVRMINDGSNTLSIYADDLTNTPTPATLAVHGGITTTGSISATGVISANGNMFAHGFLGADGGVTIKNGDINIGIGNIIVGGYSSTTTGEGNVKVSGYVTAQNVTSTSDERLKTNIKPIARALERMQQLEGVSFNWKTDGKPSLGFIAQRVEKIFPELVLTDGKGMKSVAYGNIVAIAIEAVKQLKREDDAALARLSDENAELKARLARLEGAVTKLAAAQSPSGRLARR
jgi:hypothetical protein